MHQSKKWLQKYAELFQKNRFGAIVCYIWSDFMKWGFFSKRSTENYINYVNVLKNKNILNFVANWLSTILLYFGVKCNFWWITLHFIIFSKKINNLL